MKILFIVPLPPPITGLSHASKTLLKYLENHYETVIIDFNKRSLKQEINSLKRLFQVFQLLFTLRIKSRKADIIYITISQSKSGNLKDLFTYLLIFDKLPKTIVHLHGGGLKKIIFDRHKLIFKLNKFFLKRIGLIIVLGKSLIDIFDSFITTDKIRVVTNFADDYLFCDKNNIEKKFSDLKKIKILFLSNLLPGKGYEELLDAYFSLDTNTQKLIEINFAGEFASNSDKQIFIERIRKHKNLSYHGVVSGNKKRDLFFESHIFCLPTYYYYEGQPISILEAYAAGCVVITTDHGGILDIFSDGINGFLIEKKSYQSIKKVIEHVIANKDELVKIALNNNAEAAKNYKKEKFCADMKILFDCLYRNNNE